MHTYPLAVPCVATQPSPSLGSIHQRPAPGQERPTSPLSKLAELGRNLFKVASKSKSELGTVDRYARSKANLSQMKMNMAALTENLKPADKHSVGAQLRLLNEIDEQVSKARVQMGVYGGNSYASKMHRIERLERSIAAARDVVDPDREFRKAQANVGRPPRPEYSGLGLWEREEKLDQIRLRQASTQPLERGRTPEAEIPDRSELLELAVAAVLPSLSGNADKPVSVEKKLRFPETLKDMVQIHEFERSDAEMACMETKEDKLGYRKLAELRAAGQLPDNPMNELTLCGDGVVENTNVNGKSAFESLEHAIAISNAAFNISK